MGNGPSSAKPREAPGRVRNAPWPRLITYVILIYIIFEARKRVSDIASRINALPPFSALSTPQLCKNLTELREHLEHCREAFLRLYICFIMYLIALKCYNKTK